jgi:hypothetical protein
MGRLVGWWGNISVSNSEFKYDCVIGQCCCGYPGRVHKLQTVIDRNYSSTNMPRAIISPSVLASDFGNLTAECKRMIKGGAEWLHMGPYPSRLQPISY